ncbi:MAG: NAD(P)-dependent alcohol dehydrogenase [Propionibacteriaceae bacterium]|jgi:NADPH:quinone reductase-like Zn-dependent oxidoreductase|nr:NAD(P)-dependent alcohol dehydrogenase [Propionibacteriaceae bacterium]
MAGVTALQALRAAGAVEPGQRVLVNGAAGGVGTFLVQLAKDRAAEVTAVCRQEHRDLIAGLGADRVVDYQREDFTSLGPIFDIVFDVAASRPQRHLSRLLDRRGRCVVVGFSSLRRLAGVALSRRARLLTADNTDPADLAVLGRLVDSGRITPVVERVYPIAEVAQAFEHLESGRPGGNIVVEVDF